MEHCYTSCVSVWYEYSEDDGLTWKKVLDNPAFENGVDIILATTYLSPSILMGHCLDALSQIL